MPVYFFWGEEEYLLEKELSALKKNVLKGDINALNYMKYDNPDYKTLEGILRSTPMLFGNSLYVIKANKTFIANQKGGIRESQIDDLIKDLELISDNLHIVFTCALEKGSKKKPDQRKKIYKTIAKIGIVKEFSPQFRNYEDWKYTPFIQSMAKEKDIELTKDTIKFLVETVGTCLMEIDSQLEKLKLLAYPNKKITTDMIKEISVVNEDIFKLTDLILEEKLEEFLAKTINLLEKSHYLEILALLQTMINKIFQTKVYSKNHSISEIARILGQKDKVVEINLEKISNIPLKKIVQIKQNLTLAEYNLKSGNISDPILAFEQIFTRRDV